jgi:hypothetical protein
MIRWAGRAIAGWTKPRADLIVENLCLRQQLIVLQRRVPRPRLSRLKNSICLSRLTFPHRLRCRFGRSRVKRYPWRRVPRWRTSGRP